MRLAKLKEKELTSIVWSLVEQIFFSNIAHFHLLQCDQLFPTLFKQIDGNVGLDQNWNMSELSSIDLNYFEFECICIYVALVFVKSFLDLVSGSCGPGALVADVIEKAR